MPLVQLDFPNPLNTSVQVGDTAYFSNPIDYGTTGNPLGGDQWASTTTPHLTSDQGDIIMIGPIETIIPWNGTVNSIICDMPQALFNQYFSNLIPGGCVQTVTPVQTTCSGECCDINPIIDYPVINGSNSSIFNSGLKFFWDNPTLNVADNMLHFIPSAASSFSGNCCMVNPGEKSVNGIDDFVVGMNNLWGRWLYRLQATCPSPTPAQYFVEYPPGSGGGYCDKAAYFNNNPNHPALIATNDWNNTLGNVPGQHGWYSHTANDLLNHLISFFPNDYYHGMSYQELRDARFNTQINIGGYAGYDCVKGSLTFGTETEETCTQGSFIMFSKDNKVNLSSGLGYYASATLRNDSPDKAELFNVGAGIFESSK